MTAPFENIEQPELDADAVYLGRAVDQLRTQSAVRSAFLDAA
jgi:hypothetical protein